MESSHKNEHKVPQRLSVWIGIVAVIIILVCTALVVAIFSGSKRDDSPVATSSTQGVASEEKMKQNTSQLQASVKQSKADLDAAKSALNDDSGRVKVAE